MRIDTDKLDYFDVNMIGNSWDEWTRTQASIDRDNIIVRPGGNIELTVTDTNLIKASKYCKLYINVKIPDLSDKYNYTNPIDIKITEEYKLFNKKRTRSVGITPVSGVVTNVSGVVSDNNIEDNTVFSMMGSDLNSLSIKIANNTSLSITIKEIGMYRSKDISDSQFNDMKQEVDKNYGLIIPVLMEDPEAPLLGQIWIRGDL